MKTEQEMSPFLGALNKAGARHGKKDKESLQKAHDSMAELVDGMHCAEGMTGGDDTAKARRTAHLVLAKANARHSAADLQKIKQAHDLITEAGAECPGPTWDEKLGSDDEPESKEEEKD